MAAWRQPGRIENLRLVAMARWEFVLPLERQSGTPLVQQITRAIAADIRRGRLRPGDPLPGTRTLARTLGVQRLTVVAAFDELTAEVGEQREIIMGQDASGGYYIWLTVKPSHGRGTPAADSA